MYNSMTDDKSQARETLLDLQSYLQQLPVHQSYYQHLQKLEFHQSLSPIKQDGEEIWEFEMKKKSHLFSSNSKY